jgi:NTP pyrophosphatase (non-canonical NTP hydrolase)
MNDLAKDIHEYAISKGWWNKDRNIAEVLCLIHSEVSEALEDYRTGVMNTYYDVNKKPCGFPSELADIIIRVLDVSHFLHIDIDKEIKDKMDYNKTREYRHGNKTC